MLCSPLEYRLWQQVMMYPTRMAFTKNLLDSTPSLSERLTQQCKRKYIPIIAMPTNVIEGDKEKCMAAGMDTYLTKPFEPAQLREIATDVVSASPT